MKGQKHLNKMRLVMMTSSNQTDLIKSRIAAEEHLRQIEAGKKVRGQPSKAL